MKNYKIKCSLCGMEFSEKDAKSSCGCCILAKKCALLKCPNCGFETPAEPKWATRLKKQEE